jgi:hypothetical protein
MPRLLRSVGSSSRYLTVNIRNLIMFQHIYVRAASVLSQEQVRSTERAAVGPVPRAAHITKVEVSLGPLPILG